MFQMKSYKTSEWLRCALFVKIAKKAGTEKRFLLKPDTENSPATDSHGSCERINLLNLLLLVFNRTRRTIFSRTVRCSVNRSHVCFYVDDFEAARQ